MTEQEHEEPQLIPRQSEEADIVNQTVSSGSFSGSFGESIEKGSLPEKPELENWELLEKLGSGGMSVVYKARHKIMNKLVAVKVMYPHLVSNPRTLRRFQQEAKTSARLKHPNIVSVHDCGITPHKYAYLVMDLLEGESLAELIKKEEKLEPQRAIDLFAQIALALNYAHDAGVIHRDLKPSNVVIVKDKTNLEKVIVLDFGIAKINVQDENEQHLKITHTGEVFGSPLYMSPEQCAGQATDKRSDIYSMGCLMYEALTGNPPIIGTNALDTMHKHINQPIQPIIEGKSANKLLNRINDIVMKCLEKNPDDRYASMQLLYDDILFAMRATDISWKGKQPVFKTGKRLVPANWKYFLPALLAAIFVVMAGVNFFLDSAVFPSEKPDAHYQHNSLWLPKPLPQPKEPNPEFEKLYKQSVVAFDVDYRVSRDDKPKILAAKESIVQLCLKHRQWYKAAEQCQFIVESGYSHSSIPRSQARLTLGQCLYNAENNDRAAVELYKTFDELMQMSGVQTVSDQSDAEKVWSMPARGECAQTALLYFAAAEEALGSPCAVPEQQADKVRMTAYSALHLLSELSKWKVPSDKQTEMIADSARIDIDRRTYQQPTTPIKEYETALKHWQEKTGPRSLEAAKSHYALAMLFRKDTDFDQAAKNYQSALNILRDRPDFVADFHKSPIADMESGLVSCLWHAGNKWQALQLLLNWKG